MNCVGLVVMSRLWTWKAKFLTSTQRLAELLISQANISTCSLRSWSRETCLWPPVFSTANVFLRIPPRSQPAVIPIGQQESLGVPDLSVLWKVVAGSQERALCVLCGAVSEKMRYGRCGFETARVEVAQVAHEQVRGTGPAPSRLHVT